MVPAVTSAPPPVGGAWYPAAPPPPPPARTSRTWLIVGISALAAVLLAGGGILVATMRGGPAKPAAQGSPVAGTTDSPSPTSAPSPTASPSPSKPAGPMYHVASELCGKVPFTALGNWAKEKPQQTNGGPNPYPQGDAVRVDCDFETGLDVAQTTFVYVSAWSYPSTAEALASYTAVGEVSDPLGTRIALASDNYDQDLKGYGQLARGYYAAQTRTNPKLTESWYVVVVYHVNLVLTVLVELEDALQGPTVNRATLLARTGAETKAILAQLHPS
jgi:hypothetical protein